MTLSSTTSTVIRWASSSALRIRAALIFCFSSSGEGRVLGRTQTRLVTPRTPERLRTARSAARFWYSHSTSPARVTQPLETRTVTCPSGMRASHWRGPDRGRGDVRVATFGGGGQPDLDVVGDRAHPGDPQRRPLGGPFLDEAVNPSGQGHDAVLDDDADLVRLQARVPTELFLDVVPDLFVGSRRGCGCH